MSLLSPLLSHFWHALRHDPGTACTAGIEAYNKQLTTMVCLTGASMLPTLNPQAKGQESAKDKLLVRLLPRADRGRSVFVDDVVAFNSPLSDR